MATTVMVFGFGRKHKNGIHMLVGDGSRRVLKGTAMPNKIVFNIPDCGGGG